MARLFTLVFLGSVLSIFFTARASEVHEVVSPITSMMVHDTLSPSIHHLTESRPFEKPIHPKRSGKEYLPFGKREGRKHFTGRVVGKCVKVGGTGTYTGTFKGFSAPHKTTVKFQMTAEGDIKHMHARARINSESSGEISVIKKNRRKFLNAKIKYGGRVLGSIKNKPLKGRFSGVAFLSVAPGKKVSGKDYGSFRVYYGGKLLVGKCVVIIKKNVVRFHVYGKYGGKKFFIKYSSTLNVLRLTSRMNPMMMKRNYGTVYVNYGGKREEKKFDSKLGMLEQFE